jgi:hypothetical protein
MLASSRVLSLGDAFRQRGEHCREGERRFRNSELGKECAMSMSNVSADLLFV